MYLVPLRAEHALGLVALEPVYSGMTLTRDVAEQLEAVGGTAAMEGDVVLALAGILPQWRGVGLAWAWLGRGWRGHARAITEAVRDGMDKSGLDRIEAAVRVDYVRGHRWMDRLGFVLETPVARKWGPDGADMSIYVRVI